MLELELALLLIYGVLTAVLCTQISRMIYYEHSKWSFQFGFLCLCVFWCILRVWFFGRRMTPPGWTYETLWLEMLVYWLPLNVEFATFGLLVIFYASMIYKKDWQRVKRIYGSFYVVCNVLLLVATLFKVVLSGITFALVTDPLWTSLSSMFATIVFLLLIIPMGVMVFKLVQIVPDRESATAASTLLQPTWDLIRLAVAIFIIFLSRCCYDVLATILPSVRYPLVGTNAMHVTVPIFVMLVCWEIIPSAMIVFFFRHIAPNRTYTELETDVTGVAGESSLINGNKSNRGLLSPAVSHHHHHPNYSKLPPRPAVNAADIPTNNDGANRAGGYHHQPTHAGSPRMGGGSHLPGNTISSTSSLGNSMGSVESVEDNIGRMVQHHQPIPVTQRNGVPNYGSIGSDAGRLNSPSSMTFRNEKGKSFTGYSVQSKTQRIGSVDQEQQE